MAKTHQRQLPLQLRLREDSTFDNFFEGKNEQLIHSLNQVLQTECWHQIYYWGNEASGKSHLLQACCHLGDAMGLSVAYFPLLQCRRLSPALLDSVEAMDVVCLDDIDAIIGLPSWEEAIFDLCNRIHEKQGRLIMTAKQPAKMLDLELGDLKSRVVGSLVFQLYALADQDKLAWLQQKSKARGFRLSETAGQFLLTHYQRDMPNLLRALDSLDQATLSEKKLLSIPLMKRVLSI